MFTMPSIASEGGVRTGISSSPLPSPFVIFDNKTVSYFIYGLSQYGGEDLLAENDSADERISKRYFLYLS
jgi:hypothetical protein